MVEAENAEPRSARLTAVLQALFVTFLWSTSWVLIKRGLVDMPPLTFAGLRYGLAFLFLLPLFWRQGGRQKLRRLPGRLWLRLVTLGVLFYALTQGAQFVGLAYLPAVTVNLMLSFSAVAVALMGILLLAERPSARQWHGIILSVLGVVIYFYPITVPAGQAVGFIAVTAGVLANAAAAILGRALNREGELAPLTITVVSMGVGAALLLAVGLATQGFPAPSARNWVLIGWLALVNTAFAFTLWNHTLRTLSALESSIINNSMAVQIPILAVLFLGETLSLQQLLGLVITIVGVLLVQLRKDRLLKLKNSSVGQARRRR